MSQAVCVLSSTASLSLQRLGAYAELTKPRLSGLVLMTTAVGWWLGMRQPEPLALLAATLVGTALVVGGANALNQWMERDADALMERTKRRPLPSGRLGPEEAYRFGWLLVVAGLATLAVTVNGPAASLAALSAAVYLFVYTPLKRTTSLCTLVGAVAGALPPVIGWVAARGTPSPAAWALFALLFVWQLPHFLAIALLYRDDYARAGFKMLSVTQPDGLASAQHTFLYGLALLPVSLFPALIGLGGERYFYGALVLGLGFFGIVARAALVRSVQTAVQLFLASIVYLPLVLALLAWDKVPG